ncbi:MULTISPECIES: 4'-phosphopantetheinyl transferase family protein [Niastella]|uniref:4'-phosphopantetheinyl transferase superfamily protein n=1 Tax=Niastella soli TaxID=2821487 RepID=A0ABS3Z7U0_9BACT|nr:4'-phosphopantetheinyl transferase superfamily protein [Niastella soli]MBO9205526.1 4'-phosphopantetheinyl transferase superfamily protein [Niastella soli]
MKSIAVYYTGFFQMLPADCYNRYLQQLPVQMQEKNNRFVRWQDKMADLLGKMLLLKALRSFGYQAQSLQCLQFNENNRPYLNTQTDFNISHSGNYVACAITNGIRVGIDIEEIRPVQLYDFKHVMTTSQWHSIAIAEDPLREFYRAWTIKESVIKADGKGMSLPLTAIEFDKGNAYVGSLTWKLIEWGIDPGYAACMATDYQADDLHIEYYRYACHKLDV